MSTIDVYGSRAAISSFLLRLTITNPSAFQDLIHAICQTDPNSTPWIRRLIYGAIEVAIIILFAEAMRVSGMISGISRLIGLVNSNAHSFRQPAGYCLRYTLR